MSTVYVVCGTAGHPEDHDRWIVGVWADKTAAETRAKQLQDAVDALCPRDLFTGQVRDPNENRTYGPTTLDPESSWHGYSPRPWYEVVDAPYTETT